MKRILISCVTLMCLASAQAAGPFVLVEASSLAANKCTVTAATHAALNGDYPVSDNVYEGKRGCLVDVGGVPAGNNGLSVALRSDLWGVLGPAVPFSFPRPSSSDLTPAVIRLVPLL